MSEEAKPVFEEVLEQNKERIYRICRVYAIDPVEPEDLFQEVTFGIWKAFSSFENKANVNTWVYRIALNVCMKYKQRLERKNQPSIRLESLQFEPVTSQPDKIEEEKHEALYSCIRQLSEMDQSIVILSLDGQSYKEISKVTGLTENHIAVKMKRLRQTLLNCITPKLK